jgi:uncharacterized paraquat-inducible protein A
MNTAHFDCNVCGRSFEVPSDYAGEAGRCERCDTVVRVRATRSARMAEGSTHRRLSRSPAIVVWGTAGCAAMLVGGAIEVILSRSLDVHVGVWGAGIVSGLTIVIATLLDPAILNRNAESGPKGT